MAYIGTLVGLGSIVSVTTGVGFATGTAIMGAISLTVNRPQIFNPNDIVYSFKLGLDGAGSAEGYEPLRGSGGRAPHIRVFDNQGHQIGLTKKRKKCGSGEDHCTQVVKGVKKQPSYAMIIGQDDPVCVAAVDVTYPSGDKYAWVGNWAHTCNRPWYYSDIDAHHENGSVKLLCAWLGRDGYKDAYPTAIKMHFPEFAKGFAGNGNNASYYCQENNTALAFYNNQRPHYFNGENYQEHKVTQKDAAVDRKTTQNKHAKRSARTKAPSIRSYSTAHSARTLCESPSSVGPSLVSIPERVFCHMPEKIMYPFCPDIVYGLCFDQEFHVFDIKGDIIHPRAALPDVEFDEPVVWGKK